LVTDVQQSGSGVTPSPGGGLPSALGELHVCPASQLMTTVGADRRNLGRLCVLKVYRSLA